MKKMNKKEDYKTCINFIGKGYQFFGPSFPHI